MQNFHPARLSNFKGQLFFLLIYKETSLIAVIKIMILERKIGQDCTLIGCFWVRSWRGLPLSEIGRRLIFNLESQDRTIWCGPCRNLVLYFLFYFTFAKKCLFWNWEIGISRLPLSSYPVLLVLFFWVEKRASLFWFVKLLSLFIFTYASVHVHHFICQLLF